MTFKPWETEQQDGYDSYCCKQSYDYPIRRVTFIMFHTNLLILL